MKIPDPNLAERLAMAAHGKRIEYRRRVAITQTTGTSVYAPIYDRHFAVDWARKGAYIECRMLKDDKPASEWQAWEPGK